MEKGLREACASGPLAGYPVVNLKAVLYDGSIRWTLEIAFKTARGDLWAACQRPARPAGAGGRLVTVPDSYMGDESSAMQASAGAAS